MQKAGWALGFLAICAGIYPSAERFVCRHLYEAMASGARPRGADAIAVLGGGSGNRIHRGLELMTKGYAPRIVFIGTAGEMQFAHNEASGERSWAPGRLCFPEHPVKSTAEGVRRLVEWSRENQVANVLVVSDANHLGRISAQLAAHGAADVKTHLVATGLPPRLDDMTGRWTVLREAAAFMLVKVGDALRPRNTRGLPVSAFAGI